MEIHVSQAVLSRAHKHQHLQSVAIYIPVAGSRVNLHVEPGSGLVGYLDPDTLVFSGYMEGNRLGASNLERYEERIQQAAGRLFESYPTVARFWIPEVEMPTNLIEVGHITRDYKVAFTRPGLAMAYGCGIGSTIRTDDGRQLVKTSSGHWYDGQNTFARFEEPESTFTVTEHVSKRHGF